MGLHELLGRRGRLLADVQHDACDTYAEQYLHTCFNDSDEQSLSCGCDVFHPQDHLFGFQSFPFQDFDKVNRA